MHHHLCFHLETRKQGEQQALPLPLLMLLLPPPPPAWPRFYCGDRPRDQRWNSSATILSKVKEVLSHPSPIPVTRRKMIV
jgi:hypothetical protein